MKNGDAAKIGSGRSSLSSLPPSVAISIESKRSPSSDATSLIAMSGRSMVSLSVTPRASPLPAPRSNGAFGRGLANPGELQPFGFVERRHAERGGLGRLRPGIGADDDVIRLGRHRACNVRAQRLGARLGLRP